MEQTNFVKHTIIENRVSFIPEVTVVKSVEGLQNKAHIIIVSDNDEQQQENNYKQYMNNSLLVENLKQQGYYLAFPEGQLQTYLFLYTTSNETDSAYKIARKHIQTVQKQFKNEDLVSIQFGSQFTQDYINEFLYGTFLQNYEWQMKSCAENQDNKSANKPFKQITVVSSNFELENQQFKYLSQIAKYKLHSKELNNTRANIADTHYMYERAKEFADKHKDKVTLTSLKGEEVLKEGLQLMHAVGRASTSEPILVCLKYEGNKEQPQKVQALVGKGVTYDCGGLSLKKAGMERMFGDKGGACTCLGIFEAVVALGLKVNLVCTLALVENSINGNSYRVSDIIQTLKGITVEVLNTDAEGRNILADAMTYTQMNFKPELVIDIATLTGACPAALGQTVQGVFTNQLETVGDMVKLGKMSHEEIWHLPITQYMRDNIISDQGDIRNSGKAPFGGSGSAAAFLEHFVEKDVKWYHFDIAPSNQIKGEGQPVRLVVEFFNKLAQE